jgi:HAD superfamily hydrolase (TIGR01509 family)
MSGTGLFYPLGAIFDMDGLMLDTERPVFPLWPRAARSLGWNITGEMVRHIIGINETSTRSYFREQLGPDFPYDTVRAEVTRLMEEEFAEKGIALKKGLLPLLDHLEKKKIPMAVATSTSRGRALKKLGIAGLEGRFSVMAFGDEVKEGKPAPEIFLLAARRIGLAPGQCAGFEDSPAGLLALHRAGIPSVFVKDMVEPPPEVLAGVWKRLDNLGEAPPLFGNG